MVISDVPLVTLWLARMWFVWMLAYCILVSVLFTHPGHQY